jgi:hypothetical protein
MWCICKIRANNQRRKNMHNITFFPTTFFGGNLIIDKTTLERLNFKPSEKIICYVNTENDLVIKKQKELCIFCGKTSCLHTINETSICEKCRDDLKEYSGS